MVPPSLDRRIMVRAAEVGFTGPNPLGRGLRRQRIGAVGVLLGEPLSYAFADPASVAILDGLAQALQQDGLALLIVAADAHGRGDPSLVREAAVDAWVGQFVEDDHPFVTAARLRPEPLVVIDQPHIPGVAVVGIDDEGGTRAGTGHVIDLGHRRIGVLAFPLGGERRLGPVDLSRRDQATFNVTRRRLAGVAAALPDAGLTEADVQVMECKRNAQGAGAEATAALLAGPHRPTAIVAMSDQLALGALQTARNAGLSVPGDLSVTGFDDIDAAGSADPPLTTIRQPLRERGRRVGDVVRALLAGEAIDSMTEFPVELVVRASTAGPPVIAGEEG